MAHVASRSDETVADVLCQARVRCRAGVAAGAIDLHPPRPCRRRRRQPDFELDLGVARRPGHALHAAHLHGDRHAADGGRRIDDHRRGHRRVGSGHRRQVRASPGRLRGSGKCGEAQRAAQAQTQRPGSAPTHVGLQLHGCLPLFVACSLRKHTLASRVRGVCVRHARMSSGSYLGRFDRPPSSFSLPRQGLGAPVSFTAESVGPASTQCEAPAGGGRRTSLAMPCPTDTKWSQPSARQRHMTGPVDKQPFNAVYWLTALVD
jgi:hypothetical protein